MMSATTKAEDQHHDRLRGIGCIVCRNLGHADTPAEIHHIRDSKDKLTDHMRVIPLCAIHHRTGLISKFSRTANGWQRWAHVGYHQAPAQFAKRYGAQRKLLAQVNALVAAQYGA